MLVCLYLLQNAAKVSYKMPQHFFCKRQRFDYKMRRYSYFALEVDLGAVYLKTTIPPRWDVLPDLDLNRMVYFAL